MTRRPPSPFDEFREVQSGLKGPGTVGWWEHVLPELDEVQAEALAQAAESREISHRTIATVLGKWGFEVTAAQVGHWRRTHVG
jgi:hypothetical protein